MEAWRNNKGCQATWRPNTVQLRVHLGVQEQPEVNWTPRPHPKSDFDDPHMDEKLVSLSFYWHCFRPKLIRSHWELSKEVDVHNLSRYCDTVIWLLGCLSLLSLLGALPGGSHTPKPYISVAAALMMV
jgi:hypothetical protein